MLKQLVCLASVVLMVGLSATVSYGQLGVYAFDGGGDGTSWDEAANWNTILNPDGSPGSGNPAAPPDPLTTANIPIAGVLLDATMPGQTAFRTRVGVTTPGTFNVTGGSLNVSDDISVGHSAKGTMNMSGGSVELGDDFFIDDLGNFGSTFTMAGGTLHIIDRLQMGNHGNLHVTGGEIIADDDFYILGNSTVTIDNGLMSTIDKINMGAATPAGPARLKINGGIMRSNEWTDNPDLELHDPTRFTSIIEINGSGKLQVEQVSFTIAEAQGLIAGGRLTTTALSPQHLGIQTIIVPQYFDRSNVVFTQISLVPEPASALLLAVGVLGLLPWRKRAQ